MLEPLVADAKKQFDFESDPPAGGNPDLHVLQFEKFLIEDAHELTRSAQLKSVSGRSLFILGLASINTHAQQALLKLFEEPQQGVTFVLLVPHGILMSTLRSRLMVYPEKLQFPVQKVLGYPVSGQTHRGPDHFVRQAAEFLKASYKTRSAQITALLKDEEDTKEHVRSFLTALEKELYGPGVGPTRSNNAQVRKGLEDIGQVRGYLADQSPSLKMLLEHLAATLPVL